VTNDEQAQESVSVVDGSDQPLWTFVEGVEALEGEPSKRTKRGNERQAKDPSQNHPQIAPASGVATVDDRHLAEYGCPTSHGLCPHFRGSGGRSIRIHTSQMCHAVPFFVAGILRCQKLARIW